jgi:hypothetical protein
MQAHKTSLLTIVIGVTGVAASSSVAGALIYPSYGAPTPSAGRGFAII